MNDAKDSIPRLVYLGVKCPAEVPIEDRPACFFGNGSGNCESCNWHEFSAEVHELVARLKRVG